MDEGPGRDSSRGHCQILSHSLWSELFPTSHARLSLPGTRRSFQPPPGSLACPLGWKEPPLCLPVTAWPHCAVNLCFFLRLPVSLGAPEDRSSLTHPCVPKAPDSGPSILALTPPPPHKEAAPGNGRSTQTHGQGAGTQATHWHHLSLEPQDRAARGSQVSPGQEPQHQRPLSCSLGCDTT